MISKLVDFLKEYVVGRESLFLHLGRLLRPDDLVFASVEDKPIDLGVLSHRFARMAKRLDSRMSASIIYSIYLPRLCYCEALIQRLSPIHSANRTCKEIYTPMFAVTLIPKFPVAGRYILSEAFRNVALPRIHSLISRGKQLIR